MNSPDLVEKLAESQADVAQAQAGPSPEEMLGRLRNAKPLPPQLATLKAKLFKLSKGQSSLEEFNTWFESGEGAIAAITYAEWASQTPLDQPQGGPRKLGAPIPTLTEVLASGHCPGCMAQHDDIVALAEHLLACRLPMRRCSDRKVEKEEKGQPFALSYGLNEEAHRLGADVRKKIPDFVGFPICDFHLPIRPTFLRESFPLNVSPNTYTRSSKGIVVRTYDPASSNDRVVQQKAVGSSAPKAKIRQVLDGKLQPENVGTYLNYLSTLDANLDTVDVTGWEAPPLIYDALVNYHRNACKWVVNKVKLTAHNGPARDYVFCHDYTCVLIKLPQRDGFPYCGQSDIETFFASILVGYVDFFVARAGLEMPCAMRASFGYLTPTAGGLDGAVVRLSLGVGPQCYLEAVARAIGTFVDDIFASIRFAGLKIKNRAGEKTLKEWYSKAGKLAESMCAGFAGQAALTKLALAGLFNRANGVLCALTGILFAERLDEHPLYRYAELSESGIEPPQVESGDPFLDIASMIISTARLKLHPEEIGVQPELSEYAADDVWWGLVLSTRLLMWKGLSALYVNKRARRDRLDPEDWGSDSEEEDDELYHIKLVTHGGMHAMRIALEFVLKTYGLKAVRNVGMYYELPELFKVIKSIDPSAQLVAHQDGGTINKGEVLIGDRNHCLKQNPKQAMQEFAGIHNLPQRWLTCPVIVDVTSASLEEMKRLVASQQVRLEDAPKSCLVLISSGLKNEQTGEDINPYGTVRLIVGQAMKGELLSRLEQISGLLSPGALFHVGAQNTGLHHSLRRWHKAAGTVVTGKSILGKPGLL